MDMPTKSCELDVISTKLLKQVLHSCIPAITKIINLSLDKGEFSLQWKSAVVQPLIKSLSKGTNINNYRPVSNLPFISKVAENALLNNSMTIVTHTICSLNTNQLKEKTSAVKQACLNLQMIHYGEWKTRTSLQS